MNFKYWSGGGLQWLFWASWAICSTFTLLLSALAPAYSNPICSSLHLHSQSLQTLARFFTYPCCYIPYAASKSVNTQQKTPADTSIPRRPARLHPYAIALIFAFTSYLKLQISKRFKVFWMRNDLWMSFPLTLLAIFTSKSSPATAFSAAAQACEHTQRPSVPKPAERNSRINFLGLCVRLEPVLLRNTPEDVGISVYCRRVSYPVRPPAYTISSILDPQLQLPYLHVDLQTQNNFNVWYAAAFHSDIPWVLTWRSAGLQKTI